MELSIKPGEREQGAGTAECAELKFGAGEKTKPAPAIPGLSDTQVIERLRPIIEGVRAWQGATQTAEQQVREVWQKEGRDPDRHEMAFFYATQAKAAENGIELPNRDFMYKAARRMAEMLVDAPATPAEMDATIAAQQQRIEELEREKTELETEAQEADERARLADASSVQMSHAALMTDSQLRGYIIELSSALSDLLEYADKSVKGDAELWYVHRDHCRNVLEDVRSGFESS